ncbi:DUF2336 domain-containing protein [Kaistia defluvii]|uniref:DUF2336 domain-containing protein n=1 Tax=Kaistia defluvii TaxID=410841 RepID=UPI002253428B|nr:DUF2336 domain-containing protein [Kaistia defluvii]MCX5520153.1 DUF2336 domain-containing protein [Kaistia defluvii]
MAMAVSSQQSRDAALLRAATELFVLDKTHDQAGIRRFEELAAHFLTKVSSADRAFVAERLARHPDTPGSILRMLGKDLPEIASPILRHAPGLNSFDLMAILAATGPAHSRMIATRDDLAPEVIRALRMTGDAETIALLPAAAPEAPEPSMAMPAPSPSRLPNPLEALEAALATMAARSAETVAEAPAAPAKAIDPEVEPANHPVQNKIREPLSALAAARVLTASLSAEMSALSSEPPAPQPGTSFEPPARPATIVPEPPNPAPQTLQADAETQTVVAEVGEAPPDATTEPARIEPETPAPEEVPVAAEASGAATPEAPATPAEAFLRLDRTERLAWIHAQSPAPISAPRLSPIQIDHAFRAALSRARLPMLARQRQRESLIAALAEGLRLEVDQVTALLDDPSGEALIVLLKAIGLSDTEAQQVLLFANPVIREAVETFYRLTELFQGVQQPAASRLVGQWRGEPEADPTHQPHYADAGRKQAHPAAPERSAAARVEKIA